MVKFLLQSTENKFNMNLNDFFKNTNCNFCNRKYHTLYINNPLQDLMNNKDLDIFAVCGECALCLNLQQHNWTTKQINRYIKWLVEGGYEPKTI